MVACALPDGRRQTGDNHPISHTFIIRNTHPGEARERCAPPGAFSRVLPSLEDTHNGKA